MNTSSLPQEVYVHPHLEGSVPGMLVKGEMVRRRNHELVGEAREFFCRVPQFTQRSVRSAIGESWFPVEFHLVEV